MKARLSNDTDPPLEEHRLTDGSEGWIAPGVSVHVAYRRPEPEPTHVSLSIGAAKAILHDAEVWIEFEEDGRSDCKACGDWAGPDEEIVHAEDCWLAELSESLEPGIMAISIAIP